MGFCFVNGVNTAKLLIFSFIGPAKLGRIGQECSPPFIKNVIEWKRPDWASSLPFSGTKSSRVLQKVCCKGSSNPSKPAVVDLKLVGLEFLVRVRTKGKQ